MFEIRSYTKPDGKTSYELVHKASHTVVARDDSYIQLRRIKKGLEKQAA